MQIIDSHSHLFTEEFNADLPGVIARAKAAGVTRIYMPNIDSTTVEPMLRTCRTYEGYCFPMIGLHPTSVGGGYRAELAVIKRWLEGASHPFVAIGEVGLDLYWDRSYLHEQEEALREQIGWALKYDLPLVIHCRSAIDELLAVMDEFGGESLRGIFHSFTGSEEDAARLLAYEKFMLGINGVLTFRRSDLSEVLPHLPIERIVVETDAPYLAPVPYRGRRNESAYIRFTLERMAELYGVSLEELAEVTSKNAQKVFERG